MNNLIRFDRFDLNIDSINQNGIESTCGFIVLFYYQIGFKFRMKNRLMFEKKDFFKKKYEQKNVFGKFIGIDSPAREESVVMVLR